MSDLTITEGKIGKSKKFNLIIPKLDSCMGIIYKYKDNYRIGAHAVIFPNSSNNELTLEQILKVFSKESVPQKLFVLGQLGAWLQYLQLNTVKVNGKKISQPRDIHKGLNIPGSNVVYEDLETKFGNAIYKLVAKTNGTVDVYQKPRMPLNAQYTYKAKYT